MMMSAQGTMEDVNKNVSIIMEAIPVHVFKVTY